MRSVWKLVTLSLLALAAIPLSAQSQTGSVSGSVTDRASRQPLADASISVVGTVLAGRSGPDGRFRISGVPAGTFQVRANRLGYAAETRSVTVSAGQDASVDFTIGQTAVQIDEVVVTATGEEQRKRESGNATSVVQVTPDKLATKTTLQQLLTAQAPGVYVNSPGGTTGSASRIRIRGANSVSLSNEPLVIVDGVRANSDIAGTGTIGVGGQQSSRLNDINPDDIEAIEVIKGPAAAALYGTAASNGVLQIRTKRGRAGVTRWVAHSEAGTQDNQYTFPANYTQVGNRVSNGARLTGCTLDAQTRNVCTPNVDSLVSFNPLESYSPFITGYRTSNGLSVTGGADRATYFLSGVLDRDHGVVRPNFLDRASMRANVTSQLTNKITSQVFTNFLMSRLKFPQNDNNILGVVSSGLLGGAFDDLPTAACQAAGTCAHGYLAGQTPKDIYAINTQENVERFIGSTVTTWQALSWLTATFQGGVDFLDRRNKENLPSNTVFFNSSTVDGYRQANSAQLWTYTANTSLTGVRDIMSDLRSSTTAGVQFNRNVVQGVRAFGARPLAGTSSNAGTATRFSVGETNTDNRTLGALVSEQVAWRDRLFATLAARTDNNSAFGSNFGWVMYPAASLSWVISEEPFFPRLDALSSLRLRTAYGKSGQRPEFRDAITYFNEQTVTVNANDVAGVIVGGTGNPDLKPEVSGEFEIGFEAGLLHDRLSIDFTSYNKTTTNLLIAKPLPPSLGLTTTQFDNLGRSKNSGIEVQLNGRILEMENVLFEASLSASTNNNKLTRIGTLDDGVTKIPPIVINSIQRHVEGYPLGGYWGQHYTATDLDNNGIISRVNCPGQTAIAGGPACEMVLDTLSFIGNPLPKRDLSFNPRLTLFKVAEIGALVDYRGGFKQFNNTARFRCNFGNCQEAYDKTQPLWLQARNLGQAMGTDYGYVENGDFTKLREVTVSLLAPKSWATVAKANELRLTLAGRNLKTWTNYTGLDPEVNSTPTTLFSQSDFLTQPPLRVFSARLTASF
ncbi:MAG TPA: SusC/RagA family TonB-linked outer membrane protein [Gemmatimonadaceae bacterium]|nr:SusC/RagA family TonB-linked outer membrane protein [Gemmatimonadaceae bacterium]